MHWHTDCLIYCTRAIGGCKPRKWYIIFIDSCPSVLDYIYRVQYYCELFFCKGRRMILILGMSSRLIVAVDCLNRFHNSK